MKIYCYLSREMIAKSKSIIFSFIILFSLMTYRCATNETKPVIEEVKIGKQVWMKKNLDIDTFRNGDKITEVKSLEEFIHVTENKIPALCYFNFDGDANESFGKLYNWYAVTDSRQLAPQGWRIPGEVEWTQLSDYLGGGKNLRTSYTYPIDSNGNMATIYFAGKNVGHYLKTNFGWEEHNGQNGNGDNRSGFSAHPAGYLDGNDNAFYEKNRYAAWWSVDALNADSAWFRGVSNGYPELCWAANHKSSFISLRCLKED
jgi:uncharacterized protein (TIGR02145 family)